MTDTQFKTLMEREVASMRAEVTEMRKIIVGNGSGIGLDEKMRNNEREIENMKELTKLIPVMDKRLERIEGSIAFQNKIAGVFFVAGAGYIVVEIIKFLLRGITS